MPKAPSKIDDIINPIRRATRGHRGWLVQRWEFRRYVLGLTPNSAQMRGGNSRHRRNRCRARYQEWLSVPEGDALPLAEDASAASIDAASLRSEPRMSAGNGTGLVSPRARGQQA